jgi:UDP-glucose 4-epimerase
MWGLMPSTYLVTGGCGFIGSHVYERLRTAGHDVRVLDDLSTGRRENLPADADVRVGDIRDRDAMADAATGIDGIFHLAAIASAPASIADWPGASSVNLGGTVTVLDIARAAGEISGAVPVVYASSAAVYGDAKKYPIDEDLPLQPLSGYAADKAACELHAHVAANTFGVPAIGLRLFNVYGPRQDPSSSYSGVISLLMDCTRSGNVFSVFGDGQQTRDFVWVGDVADAFLAAMSDAIARPPVAEVMNVCSGVETSLLELLAATEQATGQAIAYEHAVARAGDIRRSVGDPSRALRRLGFRPHTSLTDGLKGLFESA